MKYLKTHNRYIDKYPERSNKPPDGLSDVDLFGSRIDRRKLMFAVDGTRICDCYWICQLELINYKEVRFMITIPGVTGRLKYALLSIAKRNGLIVSNDGMYKSNLVVMNRYALRKLVNDLASLKVSHRSVTFLRRPLNPWNPYTRTLLSAAPSPDYCLREHEAYGI